MTEYDPEVIAALVSGELPPAEAAALERQLAADDRGAAALAAQRLARQALRDAPPPVLSAVERTRLREAVTTSLHLDPASAAPARPRRIARRSLAMAAAALAALAVAVPLITLLSLGGDDTASTTWAQADLTARNLEEAAPPTDDAGQLPEAATLGAAADAPDGKLIDDLLADPAGLIGFADPSIVTCSDEASALLGEDLSPVAVAFPAAPEGHVVWLVTLDGHTISHLAIFELEGCHLVAAHP